ncbi:MAG: hypothetical protein JO337_06940 [Acidimicrobiales bacterium]|nr:hypothetical protein [Acidimicrobiales bacterium]
MPNPKGVAEHRLFADPSPGPDEVSFQVPNDDARYYSSPYYKLHAAQLQPIPPPTMPVPRVALYGVVGADTTE